MLSGSGRQVAASLNAGFPPGARRSGAGSWAGSPPNSLPGGPGWRVGWETVSVGDQQKGEPDFADVCTRKRAQSPSDL